MEYVVRITVAVPPITVTAGLLEPVLVIRMKTLGNLGRRNPVSIESSHPSIAERGTHGLIERWIFY